MAQKSFLYESGERLAEEVRAARQHGLPIVMAHENDEERDGCEFATFFSTTPGDLVSDGLYKALAVAFVHGSAHRQVSLALFAKALGAVPVSTGLDAVASSMEGASGMDSVRLDEVGAAMRDLPGHVSGSTRRLGRVSIRRKKAVSSSPRLSC